MSFLKKSSLFSVITAMFLINYSVGNKYSEQANKPKQIKTEFSLPTDLKDLRQIDKPYRMHKLNLIWVKAKHRLTDPKLQSLFSDLKLHDKEELAFKHAKADGKDEFGIEEARLRKKLMDIMSSYDLLEHFEKVTDPKYLKKPKPYADSSNYIVKDLFKDQRLNKLWAKAEKGGFTHDEMEMLKEEFTHHQDKIDEYHSLLDSFESTDSDKHENSLDNKPDSWNEIEKEEEELSNDIPGRKITNDHAKNKLLKEKHLEVRSGFDHLEGTIAQAPKHKEFVEPKVQELWRLALEAKFIPRELDILKEELYHYEKRLIKLRHLHTEAALEAARNRKDYKKNATHETYIKLNAEYVEKVHKKIEEKIRQNHVEL